MESNIFIGDTQSQISHYHVFHDPLENVYSAFTDLALLSKIYSKKITFDHIKLPTTLDDEGNEITFTVNSTNSDLSKYLTINDTINNNTSNCKSDEMKDIHIHNTPHPHYTFTLKTEYPVKSKFFYSFKLRSIFYPCQFCPFIIGLQFYWDTISEVTVFHYDITIEESQYKHNLWNILQNSDLIPYNSIEKHWRKTIRNLEEVESISMNENIDIVWDFISKNENWKFFFPVKNIEIKVEEGNLIKIIDSLNKNEIKWIRKVDINPNGITKKLQLELFESILPMPKQLIIITVAKLQEKVSLIIFQHIILEYIPYDALRSNSAEKQRILRRIKKILEKGEDVKNTSNNSNPNCDNSGDLGKKYTNNLFNELMDKSK